MAWTTPKTWVPGEIPGATDLNALLRDNLNHLFTRPLANSVQTSGADYYFSTGAYFDLDPGALNLALTVATGRVMIGGSFFWAPDLADNHIMFRCQIDGGLSYEYLGYFKAVSRTIATPIATTMITAVVTTLAPNAPHTFALQTASAGGFVRVFRTATQPFRFWVLEV